MNNIQKQQMDYVIEQIDKLCKRFHCNIESFCDLKTGTPHAVISMDKTETFFNLNNRDLDYSFGEEIKC